MTTLDAAGAPGVLSLRKAAGVTFTSPTTCGS